MMDGCGEMGLVGAIVMPLFFVAVVRLWSCGPSVPPSLPDIAALARRQWAGSRAAMRRAGSIAPRLTKRGVSVTVTARDDQ